jgi:secondary thiamine-phosphate synthase enzyme
MKTYGDDIHFKTSGEGDIVDITGELCESVAKSEIKDGIACLSVFGSTGSITTVEYEPGLVSDLNEAVSRLFPKDIEYEHHLRWHDGNGHSHVRASFIGPGITLPVRDGAPVLGTWQQVIFLEYDVKPRKRRVVVQVLGC